MENTKPAPQKPQVIQTQPTSGGINLLPEVAEKEIKSGVYKRKANIVSLLILGFIGVAIVSILILQGVLALKANSIKNKTAEAEDRIREKQSIEIKALATKEKLDKIKQLLTEAIPSSTFIGEVAKDAATSQPVVLTNITISKNGEAFVDGTAVNSEMFKQWVANLTSESSQEYFNKISVASFTGNPTEGYKFSFKLSFLKKGVYSFNEK